MGTRYGSWIRAGYINDIKELSWQDRMESRSSLCQQSIFSFLALASAVNHRSFLTENTLNTKQILKEFYANFDCELSQRFLQYLQCHKMNNFFKISPFSISPEGFEIILKAPSCIFECVTNFENPSWNLKLVLALGHLPRTPKSLPEVACNHEMILYMYILDFSCR